MIDLHTHSTFSDGTFSPSELIDYAILHNIKTLALTDHDTVDGVDILIEDAKNKNIEVLTGVELSINWHNKVIHVLGLNIDINDSSLKELLASQQALRTNRAYLIAELLEKATGLTHVYEKALSFATGGLVARPHFAKVLIQEGICKDMKKAFSSYLKRGKSAYVNTSWVSLEKGIECLISSGGCAVLAHPTKYKLTRTKLSELINDFKHAGGIGMEVISGISSNDEISHLSALCQKFDLLASVGSDFHGELSTPYSMKRLRALPMTCQALMDSPLMEKK